MKKFLKKIFTLVLVFALIISASPFDSLKKVYANATPSEIEEEASEISEDYDSSMEEPEDTNNDIEDEPSNEATPSDAESEDTLDEQDAETEETEEDEEVEEVEEIGDEVNNEASPSEIEGIIEEPDLASPSDIEQIIEEINEASPSDIDDTYAVSVIDQIKAFDSDAAYLVDGKIVFKKDVDFNKTVNVNEDICFDFGGYTIKGIENADPVFDIKNVNVVFVNGKLCGTDGEDNKNDRGGDGGNAIRFYSENGSHTLEINNAKVYGGNGGKGKGKDYPSAGASLMIGSIGYGSSKLIEGGQGGKGGGNGGTAVYITNIEYDLSNIKYTDYSIIAGNAGDSYLLLKSPVRFGAPSEYDLRNISGNNYITKLKNQGSKATCFAFAPIAQAETYMIKNYSEYATNILGKNIDNTLTRTTWDNDVTDELDFSESYYAMSTYLQPKDIFGNAGNSHISTSNVWYDNGASINMADILVTAPRGVVLHDPALDNLYNSGSALVNETNRNTLSNYNEKVVIRAKEINIHRAEDYANRADLINDMKTDIMDNAGVVLSLVFTSTYTPTVSGYVETYYSDASAVNGHALYVIGWNDNITKDQLGCASLLDRDGAFIVKDSHNHFSLVPFGADFGSGSGYTVFNWEPVLLNYENHYYLDSGNSDLTYSNILSLNNGSGTEIAKLKYKTICNAYKIKNTKEKIKAISYYAYQNDVISVEICKSDGLTADKYKNATSLWSNSGISIHRGNNVITVGSDISCAANEYIFVKIKSNTASALNRMMIDKNATDGPLTFHSTYVAQSYMSDLTTDSFFNYSGGDFKPLFEAVKTDCFINDFSFLGIADPWSFNFRIKLLTNSYIKLDANGGTFIDDSSTEKYILATYGQPMGTLPVATNSNVEKTFLGYNTAANGSGTDYDATTKYMPEIAKTLTLYAKYYNPPAPPPDPVPPYNPGRRIGGGSGGGGGGGGGGGVKANNNTPNQKTLAAEVASTTQNSALAIWEKDAMGMWHMNFNVAGQNMPVLNSWVGLETDVNLNGVVIKVVDYYFLDENGQMYTGWLTDTFGNKYFLNNSMGNEAGKMCFNTWKSIEGKQYYFGADGKLLTNSVTPDGNLVDANGQKINDTSNNTENTQIGPMI